MLPRRITSSNHYLLTHSNPWLHHFAGIASLVSSRAPVLTRPTSPVTCGRDSRHTAVYACAQHYTTSTSPVLTSYTPVLRQTREPCIESLHLAPIASHGNVLACCLPSQHGAASDSESPSKHRCRTSLCRPCKDTSRCNLPQSDKHRCHQPMTPAESGYSVHSRFRRIFLSPCDPDRRSNTFPCRQHDSCLGPVKAS